MRIPYLDLGRVTVNKITGKAIGRTEAIIKAILLEIPELIAVAVVEVKTARVLSAYTTSATFDPYKTISPNVQLLTLTQAHLATPHFAGQAIEDIVILLDKQLHCLRPMHNGLWYCYLVVATAETNLVIARDVLRRCTR